MIQPNELKLNLPMELSNGVISTTTIVWDILVASRNGEMEEVRKLADECPELIYAQYNYTPPIHFAVREGHIDLVKYLLGNGAHDPAYKIYPFLDTLATVAEERGFVEIAALLKEYSQNSNLQKFKGDNGTIQYNRTPDAEEFQQAVHGGNLGKTERLLKEHPEFALDETYFWGEGILVFAAKENNRQMIDLLMSYGAKVPDILKWAQGYYFKDVNGAAYILEKGTNPNVMSWQRVTILHNVAQMGDILKAELLINYGANINCIDDEYQSTPLGMAARWGNAEMVSFLLKCGADPIISGAPWSTALAWARKKGHPEIETILKDFGAS